MSDPIVKELDLAEVIERFDELLDAAERGETIRIFRNGRPIALMGPHREELADDRDVVSG
jgi:antitoxin (DNA-binding transcriptional repressor) of toxin-antitoxin stability system